MPEATDVGDVYLMLTLCAPRRAEFLLRAYDAMPTGREAPRVSAVLPGINYKRLHVALNVLGTDHNCGLQQMGDSLATWLFLTQPDTTATPTSPSALLCYNPVGSYLRERAELLTRSRINKIVYTSFWRTEFDAMNAERQGLLEEEMARLEPFAAGPGIVEGFEVSMLAD